MRCFENMLLFTAEEWEICRLLTLNEYNKCNIRSPLKTIGYRLSTSSACIFSVILHEFRLTGASPPALNLYNLTKNLTAHLRHYGF